ncbi:hypothetical protein FACS189441_7010 [Betaproteobacteria bacterium]|nr:hypothetical protein FACS189441_7010 [Betaproteobacteria bacterium]
MIDAVLEVQLPLYSFPMRQPHPFPRFHLCLLALVTCFALQSSTWAATASQVLAPAGDITLQGQSVDILAGKDTFIYDNRDSYEKSGLTIGASVPVISAVQGVADSAKMAGKSKDDRVNALAAANTAMSGYQAYGVMQELAQNGTSAQSANVKVSVTVGNQKNEQSSHIESSRAAASEVSAGKNITITATGGEERQGDLSIQGSDLIAEGDIRLSAQNDLNLIAAEQTTTERDKNKSSGWNAGVAFEFGQGGFSFGITAGGNVGKGYGDGDETSYRNSHIISDGKVTLHSKADTRLVGAQVEG